jgi:N-acetylmuramoyl-L-alanine amidase
MIITQAPSPNFGPRAAGKKISLLILHYTDTQNAFAALEIMQSPERAVSAHYLVDTDGATHRLVDENMRAWHAGASWWEGEQDINSCSIGIEIQNAGHSFGYEDFPAAQMRAVGELCLSLRDRHKILPYHVLAHSDIAPGRKRDPGEKFPWRWLAQNGTGLWPQVTDDDMIVAEDTLDAADPAEAVKSLLTRYGYDARLDLSVLLPAFCQHFDPEAFMGHEPNHDLPGVQTVARMAALIRQKLALRPKIS